MNFLNRNLFLMLGVGLLCAVVYYFSDIVTYILIAWVLSMLGGPLVQFFKKRIRIGRFSIGSSVAAMLTIILFYTSFIGAMWLFVPTIVGQARNLADIDYQALGEKLRGPFAQLDARIHQIGMLETGESLATKTQEILSRWFKPTLIGDFLESFIGVAGNLMITIASVTFILFFFLKENDLFLDILHALVPNEQERKVQSAVTESSVVLTRYFRGLLIQMLAFSAMATLLLWILGNKNAMLIGSIGAVLNVIPYVGIILGMIFGVFITISSNLDTDFALMVPMLLKVAATFIVIHLIDSNLLGPLIMSKSVHAHPLEIFIVILVAAKIGGITGMLIGIPVYTVLRVIAREFFSEFKIVKLLTDHLDE